MTTEPKQLTKKERRLMQLNRHYRALEQLYNALHPGTITIIDGKRLSTKLLGLERTAHRIMLELFSREETPADVAELDRVEAAVLKLFDVDKIPGFFLNSDARGYCLKIDDEVVRTTFPTIEFQRDMGGYGLLAPEITGD